MTVPLLLNKLELMGKTYSITLRPAPVDGSPSINQVMLDAVAAGKPRVRVTLAGAHPLYEWVFEQDVEIPPGLTHVELASCGGLRRARLLTRAIRVAPNQLVEFVLRGLRLIEQADCTNPSNSGRLFEGELGMTLRRLAITDTTVILRCNRTASEFSPWIDAFVREKIHFSGNKFFGEPEGQMLVRFSSANGW
jgi:hypothetical protein